ncbi:MAG: 30S ribosomal protein S2 [Candidatus Paceibacterota bacterium]
MTKENTKTESNTINKKAITEMIEAGVLYGHKKSKVDPRMRKYIAANRHEIDLLDANAVESALEEATKFLSSVIAKNEHILFVGTMPSSIGSVEKISSELNQPYVKNRWLGGTLTNFKVIRKRIDYYQDLRKQQEEGKLEKYTKKEQVDFAKEIDKLSMNFEGLKTLDKFPGTVFVINPKEHETAVNEAMNKEIPVVAIMDTNDNPDVIDYPILANDHSVSSINWVIETLISNLKK